MNDKTDASAAVEDNVKRSPQTKSAPNAIFSIFVYTPFP